MAAGSLVGWLLGDIILGLLGGLFGGGLVMEWIDRRRGGSATPNWTRWRNLAGLVCVAGAMISKWLE